MADELKTPVTEETPAEAVTEETPAAAVEETPVEAVAEETAPEAPVEAAPAEEAPAEEAPAEEAKAEEAPAEETASEAPAEEAPAEEAKTEEKPAEPVESMSDFEKEIDASLHRYEPGEKVKATVISVDDDQVIVELGYTGGVISKANVTEDPSYNLKEHINVGDTVDATVVKADDGHGHVVLSMKAAAQQASWERLLSLLKSKDDITVKINGVTKAGVTTIVEGIRGFIPASKLSLGYIAEDELPKWVGKDIDVRVITAEKDGKKLVLSAKDILQEKERAERKEAAAQVKVGLVTEGTVETIKEYGAFVNIGKGVTGLLHVSQISQKRIKTPAEVLKEGQTVKVKVTKVADGRISLSMKALDDSAPDESRSVEVSFKLPKSESIGTGLGDLLKNLKLN